MLLSLPLPEDESTQTQYDGSFSLEIETGRIWSYLGASRSPSIAEIWSLTA